MIHDRVLLSPIPNRPIPIYAESMGYNQNQEKLDRPHGYPHYHWLQTTRGEGRFSFEGTTFTLQKNSGILLSPHTPHTYQTKTGLWETVYITFGGQMVQQLLNHIGLKTDAIYRWETESPLNTAIFNMLKQSKRMDDAFGLYHSSFVYQFLLKVNYYAGFEKNPEVSEKLARIKPLINWMNANLSNPDIGIHNFADFLNISPRQLNALFQEIFTVSPYAYFLNLRIKKAKELLYQSDHTTVKTIAKQVGFRSVSHFVATFRRQVGLSPERYRVLR